MKMKNLILSLCKSSQNIFFFVIEALSTDRIVSMGRRLANVNIEYFSSLKMNDSKAHEMKTKKSIRCHRQEKTLQ